MATTVEIDAIVVGENAAQPPPVVVAKERMPTRLPPRAGHQPFTPC